MTDIRKYKTRQITVEAMQWDGSMLCGIAIVEWAEDLVSFDGNGVMIVSSPDGDLAAYPTEYIVKEGDSTFYPVDPCIFLDRYELSEDQDA